MLFCGKSFEFLNFRHCFILEWFKFCHLGNGDAWGKALSAAWISCSPYIIEAMRSLHYAAWFLWRRNGKAPRYWIKCFPVKTMVELCFWERPDMTAVLKRFLSWKEHSFSFTIPIWCFILKKNYAQGQASSKTVVKKLEWNSELFSEKQREILIGIYYFCPKSGI